MRDETRIHLRSERPVREYIFLGELPIRYGIALLYVFIWIVIGRAAALFQIKAVHLPVVPTGQKGRQAVTELDLLIETHGLQLQQLTFRIEPLRNGVGMLEAVPQIVEAAVFLDDDHDVRNRA